MTASIFALLEKVGFTHPLHPPLTHIPMGMVMGCFFFGLLAWKAKKTELSRTALHCSVLAILFIVPTILAGILDWQHRFGGSFTPLIIIKIIMAPILTGLLAYTIWLHRQGAPQKKLFIVYALCLVCAVGLGFCGGELVYGG
jgi:uncharacterized membrane protein